MSGSCSARESDSHELRYLSVFLLSLSFGLWKHGNPAIRFAVNNLFLSHNNQNFRAVLSEPKLSLIPQNECVFFWLRYGLETVDGETGSDFLMQN